MDQQDGLSIMTGRHLTELWAQRLERAQLMSGGIIHPSVAPSFSFFQKVPWRAHLRPPGRCPPCLLLGEVPEYGQETLPYPPGGLAKGTTEGIDFFYCGKAGFLQMEGGSP